MDYIERKITQAIEKAEKYFPVIVVTGPRQSGKSTLCEQLYGITSLVLILPLYPKSTDYSVADKQDFKVCLAKVKLKDAEVWAKDHLLPNSLSLPSKTPKKVG